MPNAMMQQQQQQVGQMTHAMNQQQVAASSSVSTQGVVGLPSMDALVNMDQNEARSTLGEILYPLVLKIDASHAGKVTGMLLNLDVIELLHLIETPSALGSKVDEARAALEKNKTQSV